MTDEEGGRFSPDDPYWRHRKLKDVLLIAAHVGFLLFGVFVVVASICGLASGNAHDTNAGGGCLLFGLFVVGLEVYCMTHP